jgi:Thiamine pyrophosphate enzyme, central domain
MFSPKPSSSVRMKKELERAKIAVMLHRQGGDHDTSPARPVQALRRAAATQVESRTECPKVEERLRIGRAWSAARSRRKHERVSHHPQSVCRDKCRAECRGSISSRPRTRIYSSAPLIHSVKGKDLMSYDDPHWMGGLGMIGTKPVYDAVMRCDLLLMVGTDYPYSNFLPQNGNVIQIDERAQVLGRRAPTMLGVVGSAGPTLTPLLQRLAQRSDSRFWDEVTRERRHWDERLDKQADLARSADRIHPQAVARMVGELVRPSPSRFAVL